MKSSCSGYLTLVLTAFDNNRTPLPDPDISSFLTDHRAEKGITPRCDITDQVRPHDQSRCSVGNIHVGHMGLVVAGDAGDFGKVSLRARQREL